MATVTLLYPVPAAGAKPFDMDYYLSKHMPSVDKAWKSAGLQKWTIVKLDPKSGYDTQAILVWDSLEKFGAAMESSAGKEVLGDIPNFSTTAPERVWGSVVGSN
jgi:uncharacterized protein (TIGR02118 family)